MLDLMRSGKPGDFIVRDLHSHPDGYSLLVCGASPIEPLQLILERTSDGNSKLMSKWRLQGSTEHFGTIAELIHYYASKSHPPLGIALRLRRDVDAFTSGENGGGEGSGNWDDMQILEKVNGLARTAQARQSLLSKHLSEEQYRFGSGSSSFAPDSAAHLDRSLMDSIVGWSVSKSGLGPGFSAARLASHERVARRTERVKRIASEQFKFENDRRNHLLAHSAEQGNSVVDNAHTKDQPQSLLIQMLAMDGISEQTKDEARRAYLDYMHTERDLVEARLSAARQTAVAMRGRLGLPMQLSTRKQQSNSRKSRPRKSSDQSMFGTGPAYSFEVPFVQSDPIFVPSQPNPPLQSQISASIPASESMNNDTRPIPSALKRTKRSVSFEDTAEMTSYNEQDTVQSLVASEANEALKPARKRRVRFDDDNSDDDGDDKESSSIINEKPKRRARFNVSFDEDEDQDPVDEDAEDDESDQDIRKVRTGMSFYRRVKRPETVHGSEGVVDAEGEENEIQDIPSTPAWEKPQIRRRKSSILSEGKTFFGPGHSSTEGYREEELLKFQKLEAAERDNRDKFEYKMRKALNKIETSGLDFAEQRVERERLNAVQTTENERRVKWDRAWERRELSVLINRPDASSDLLAHLNEQAERDKQFEIVRKERRRSAEDELKNKVSSVAAIFGGFMRDSERENDMDQDFGFGSELDEN